MFLNGNMMYSIKCIGERKPLIRAAAVSATDYNDTQAHTHTICSDQLGPRSRVEALYRVHTPPACTDCRNAASPHRTAGRNLQDNTGIHQAY